MLKEATTQTNEKRQVMHETPTDLNREGVAEITADLRRLLADAFALYLKTKNFHWHMTGRHFRDYHLLLDEHSEQIFAMTDDIAERCAQNWRNYIAVDRRYLPVPALDGQRRRKRCPYGNAGRAQRR